MVKPQSPFVEFGGCPQHTCQLLRAELRMAHGTATAAKAEARDEQMLRLAHEGRNKPLRGATPTSGVHHPWARPC